MSEIGLIRKIANNTKDAKMIIINNRQFNKLCAELSTDKIECVNTKLKLLNLPIIAIMN